MSNVGKKFEQDFANSIPSNIALIRIQDSAQSFYRSSNLRFSLKNPYDYLLWNPKTLTLYALELKTVKGKSISFERTKDEHGEIHYHQIQGLKKISDIGECVSGFIVNFRELEKTIFIEIDDFLEMMEENKKKSFNFNDLELFKVPYVLIPQNLLRTRYRYDIETFLNDTRLH